MVDHARSRCGVTVLWAHQLIGSVKERERDRTSSFKCVNEAQIDIAYGRFRRRVAVMPLNRPHRVSDQSPKTEERDDKNEQPGSARDAWRSTRPMTRLTEITRERFGVDADRLLDAHAVIPLINHKNKKAPIAGWQAGFDPSIDIGFHSLALLTGPRSGITVWDVDCDDRVPPTQPNVRTSKGIHIYTAHEGGLLHELVTVRVRPLGRRLGP